MNRRGFLGTAAAAASISVLGRDCVAQGGSLPSFTLSHTGCGRATGYCEANKIVTLGSKTHVAWLDSEGEKFLVRVRTRDSETGAWSASSTVGEAYDNHGGPAMAVDSRGHLHIVYYPHHHPFRYRRSVRPNDASGWTEEIQFGTRCTYPAMVCLPDDTLVLVCRERTDGPWVLNLYRKPPGGNWTGPRTLLRGIAPSGYTRWQAALALDAQRPALHMSFMVFEGSEGPGYAVGYWRSSDRGETWERSDGSKVAIPATPSTIEIIDGAPAPTRETDLRPGNIAVDRQGVPWIIYARLNRQPFETWLACPTPKGSWRKVPLLPAIQSKWPDRTPQTPGQIAFDAHGVMYVALTTVSAKTSPHSFWGDVSDEVALLVSRDSGRTFEVLGVSPPDDTVPNWLPSLERPTRHVPIAKPSLMYTHGHRGENNRQIVSNDVVWCDLGP